MLKTPKSAPLLQQIQSPLNSRKVNQIPTLSFSTVDVSLCSECISGRRDCVPQQPICWAAGECQGNELYFVTSPTKEDCLEECKNTFNCTWFTYRSSESHESICHLFTDCPTIDETCETCISGERRCEAGEQTTTSTTSTTSTSSAPGKVTKRRLFWQQKGGSL